MNCRCPFPARRDGSNARAERDAAVTVGSSPAASKLVKEEADKIEICFSRKALQFKCLNTDFAFTFVCIIYAAQTVYHFLLGADFIS